KAGCARGPWCAPSRRSHCRCGPEPLWRYLAFDAPDHLRDTVKTNRDRLRAPKGLTQTPGQGDLTETRAHGKLSAQLSRRSTQAAYEGGLLNRSGVYSPAEGSNPSSSAKAFQAGA